MRKNIIEKMRDEAKKIFSCAIDAADPYKAVRDFLCVEKDRLVLGRNKECSTEFNLNSFKRIFVVGGGKATAPMAKSVEDLIGSRIDKGVIAVKYGFTEDLVLSEMVEAGHPVPDKNSIIVTEKILGCLKSAGEEDLIISLISGGGSALLCSTSGDISIYQKQKLTQNLLECGASIDEINTVRKHISSTKGGKMAKAAFPATVINLMLSDVVGDRIDVIASGPFTPDTSTYTDAWEILKKYNLQNISSTIQGYIKAGMKGLVSETPKTDDPIFRKVYNCIIASNISALKAAGQKAESFGYNTLILSSMMEGKARELAHVHTAIAGEIAKNGLPVVSPACIISGGETTVTIKGSGKGGRNQEFCLSAACDLAGLSDQIIILCGGSDGNDGPTDAAGAVVDPFTVIRGQKHSLDAMQYLNNNDSYNFFRKTDDLLITGPTNTNVMDVRLILVR